MVHTPVGSVRWLVLGQLLYRLAKCAPCVAVPAPAWPPSRALRAGIGYLLYSYIPVALCCCRSYFLRKLAAWCSLNAIGNRMHQRLGVMQACMDIASGYFLRHPCATHAPSCLNHHVPVLHSSTTAMLPAAAETLHKGPLLLREEIASSVLMCLAPLQLLPAAATQNGSCCLCAGSSFW